MPDRRSQGVDPHSVVPEWAHRRDVEVPELLGVASYVCPPDDASWREIDRAACAVSEWSDDDPSFLARGCRLARRRLSDGRIRSQVVTLLERALARSRRLTPGRSRLRGRDQRIVVACDRAVGE
jgi:hypothetical protein